jgi:hypothetical protein
MYNFKIIDNTTRTLFKSMVQRHVLYKSDKILKKQFSNIYQLDTDVFYKNANDIYINYKCKIFYNSNTKIKKIKNKNTLLSFYKNILKNKKDFQTKSFKIIKNNTNKKNNK